MFFGSKKRCCSVNGGLSTRLFISRCATKSNGLSSVLSAQKSPLQKLGGVFFFFGVIECERHRSFHRIDDTSWAQTNCLFEKVMKYLLSIAVQISSSN